MAAIKRNPDQLRRSAAQVGQLGDRMMSARGRLDSAVAPARRGDVPELGQIDALYSSLKTRMTRTTMVFDRSANTMRGYATASEAVEDMLRSFRLPLRNIFGSGPGTGKGQSGRGKDTDPTSFKVGVERAGKEEKDLRSFGDKQGDPDPYVGNVWTMGGDVKMFGTDTPHRWLERDGKFIFVPTASWVEAEYGGSRFAEVKAGRIAGGVRAEANAGVKLEAKISSHRRIGNEKVNITSTGELSATAEASANASGQITKDGVRGQVGGRLGVEARATARQEAKVSGVSGKVAIWGSAGAGAEAKLDGSISLDKVKFETSFGGSLGLGGGVNVNVEIDPKETYGDAKDLAEDAAGSVKKHADPRNWDWGF